MTKEFNPNFKTDEADYCREELNKLNSSGMRGTLADEINDASKPDLGWEAEQLAKSYGIYLEFDRAKTGSERDWIYMIRVTIPGGGAISKKAWRLFDELADTYAIPSPVHGNGPSLRLTTRQNVQFHWIRKEHLLDVVRRIAESGFSSLNGCGDNTRNVMACPLSRFSDVFDANHWARKIGRYFSLPTEAFIHIFQIDPNYVRSDVEEKRFAYGKTLLNRKFKVAIATVHRHETTAALVADNCVEALTNDVAIAPVFDGEQFKGFQLCIGGGQGERNGKPTMSTLARPFAFVREEQLIEVLDAIVKVHQEWGDRQNRNWARLKYVVKKMGIAWYRERVQERLSFELKEALPDFDFGARQLHYGWSRQKSDNLWTFGAFIENGRLVDAPPNGRLKTAVKELIEKYPVELTITPNQDLLFNNIPEEMKAEFEQDLRSYGYGERNGAAYSDLRLCSGACVGKTTCRLAYTDSETFEPLLIDELERRGFGTIHTSIGVTGCERQCYRPATKAIGLVGSGANLYQLKLLGTEDGRHQGQPLISEDGLHSYLRYIPREQVASVIEALFQFYLENRLDGEELGYFNRRVGLKSVIEFLKGDARTAALMEKTSPANVTVPASQ